MSTLLFLCYSSDFIPPNATLSTHFSPSHMSELWSTMLHAQTNWNDLLSQVICHSQPKTHRLRVLLFLPQLHPQHPIPFPSNYLFAAGSQLTFTLSGSQICTQQNCNLSALVPWWLIAGRSLRQLRSFLTSPTMASASNTPSLSHFFFYLLPFLSVTLSFLRNG